MLAVRLHALKHAAHLDRHVAVDAVENEFGVAQDGVERRSQLMAHVGQELRLVLAHDLELAALVADLAEQAGVLDRQHGLGGEGLQQVDGVLGKLARRLAAHNQRADDLVGAEERHDQQRAKAGPHHHIEYVGGRFAAHVGDLDGTPLRRRLSHTGVAQADVPLLDAGDQVLVHAVGRAQTELAIRIVEIVDRAGVGAGELHRLGDDRAQDRLRNRASS